ncbi:hypothetical protein, partial [Streptococcus anginosus]|uniref:hypothetical protein n=1 Tax=Streptococcus anginosus TaxID=1328 RepID=UPI0021F911D7
GDKEVFQPVADDQEGQKASPALKFAEKFAVFQCLSPFITVLILKVVAKIDKYFPRVIAVLKFFPQQSLYNVSRP